MKLIGTITFHGIDTDGLASVPTTGVKRPGGEIALDFRYDEMDYTVALRPTKDAFTLQGQWSCKFDRAIGQATCDAYEGANKKKLLIGQWTEAGYTYFWFARLSTTT